jgi:tRNA pseudouridine32 synthase/23S rRNA pseudouridine746 synthase
MRDGVSASCVALPVAHANPWPTLLDFLAQRLPYVSRNDWHARMSQGSVLDEQGQALRADAPYPPQPSDAQHHRVYYYRTLLHEPTIPFEAQVLFQDEFLVVADKPHFLPVTPAGRYVQETLLVRLKRQLGIETLSPLHRIDRETAGLVLFSVRPQDRGAYSAMFRNKVVTKHYEAIAPWRADLTLPHTHRSRMETGTPFFRQHEVPGEPNSETRIELMERLEQPPPHSEAHSEAHSDTHGGEPSAKQAREWARYRLTPVTGKTHQLRVHMNALGLPIEGDLFYPLVVHGPDEVSQDFSQPLQLLARSVHFKDPVTGATRQFESQRALG